MTSWQNLQGFFLPVCRQSKQVIFCQHNCNATYFFLPSPWGWQNTSAQNHLKWREFLLPPPQTLGPKISASVDGGLSGGSSVRRPGSEGPHRRQRKFIYLFQVQLSSCIHKDIEVVFHLIQKNQFVLNLKKMKLSSSKNN